MRLTKEERELATHKVANLLAKGFNRQTIRNIIEADIGYTSLQSQNKLIKDAALLLKADIPEAEELRAINNERLDLLYGRALESDKLGDALKAVDLQNKTNGIYIEKKEIKVESDIEFEVSFGDGNKS